jgi:hypothetical protein
MGLLQAFYVDRYSIELLHDEFSETLDRYKVQR